MEKKGKEAKAKVLWKLFISTLYLSAFTFGGGYDRHVNEEKIRR